MAAQRGPRLVIRGGNKIDKLIRDTKRAQRRPMGIRIGFFASAKYQDGTPVAAVAAWHEFGAPKVRLPSRPYFPQRPARTWRTPCGAFCGSTWTRETRTSLGGWPA